MIESRRMKWVGHESCVEDRRGACKVSVGRPEGKRALGRPRHRWEDNTKMDVKEIGWDIMEWVYLAQQEHVVGRWLMTNRSNCAKTILFAK